MKLNTKVDVTKSEDLKYVKMVIDPLDKGYGITLGNSIRRVLLSSLPGAAVTAIRINNIDHEFSTIEGVKEDIIGIILNIKKIIFVSTATQPKTINIEVNKKGEVTASAFKTDSEITIINPEQYIATITGEKVNLKIELRVEKGVGYRLAEANHYEDMPIGVIPIDSAFSPILRVNHIVENTRVGNRTDLDKLTLEVWSNGSIDAEKAVEEASKILIDSFSLFTDYKHIIKAQAVVEVAKADDKNTALDLTVEDLELSARSSNCLRKAGINNVEELISKPMRDLMKIKNFGKKSADEINEKLAQYGLKLKSE